VICCVLILIAACGRAPDQAASAPSVLNSRTAGTPDASDQASRPAAAHAGFPQGAYIWQRIWTPEHRGVLASSHELFAELRVLAAQQQPGEGWSDAHVDLDALRIDGRKVRPVIRLDGGLPTLDAGQITMHGAMAIAQWRAAGVGVDGIEIDFEGPVARLDQYARVVDALRAKLPHDVVLSITVAPDWIGAAALPAMLDRADESVLQLHATSEPTRRLFDARQVTQWIAQFGALTRKPFRIALPSYASSLDAAASSDDPMQPGERHELSADPLAVAKFLRDLERTHPDNLQGVLWFRLPLPGDRRAWPMLTLAAVINAQPLRLALVADAHASGNGVFDVEVSNRGTLESALPAQVEISTTACPQNDASPFPGYRIEPGKNVLRFVRESDARLPAGQSRTLGRVTCTRLTSKDLHVLP
jgi:hypothetical protein